MDTITSATNYGNRICGPWIPKLFTAREGFIGTLQNLGVRAPKAMAWVVGITEFFGGLLLVVGAFVSVVAVLGILNMFVAMFLVHLPNGFKFSNNPPGVEVNLLYIAGFLALIIGGSGALSVDRLRAAKQREASPQSG